MSGIIRGFEGQLVRLVAIDYDRHGDNALRWLSDPDTLATLGIGYWPLTAKMEREYFETATKHGENIPFAIETLDGVHIGMSGVHNISLLHGTATTGSFIGETEYRGKGYGTDAARVRARYCFETINLQMLYSEFLDGNQASARMQEKAGYRIWGTKPRALWKDGKYIDLVQTCLDRETWLSISR